MSLNIKSFVLSSAHLLQFFTVNLTQYPQYRSRLLQPDLSLVKLFSVFCRLPSVLSILTTLRRKVTKTGSWAWLTVMAVKVRRARPDQTNQSLEVQRERFNCSFVSHRRDRSLKTKAWPGEVQLDSKPFESDRQLLLLNRPALCTASPLHCRSSSVLSPHIYH